MWYAPKWLPVPARRLFWLPLLLLVALPIGGAGILGPLAPSAALADDDGDDGGGGQTARNGGGNERLGNPRTKYRAVRRAKLRAKAAPRRARIRPHVIAIGLDAGDKTALQRAGYVVVADIPLLSLANTTLTRLRVPPRTSIATARQEVARLAAVAADTNGIYRPVSEPACSKRSCNGLALANWQSALITPCAGEATIGMIDTAIDTGHDSLRAAKVTTTPFRPEGRKASGNQHGTAIAALLAGQPGTSVPGLLPKARLIAADPFYSAGRAGDQAEVFDVVRAFDHVLAQDVIAINMSLSGPANTVIAAMMEVAEADGVQVVASAGNQGPRAQPAYPAAYASVLAVTAVDANKAVYRRAGQGAHIDLAAPGVNILSANVRGGTKAHTGTSFAAPFVTASVAVLKSRKPSLRPGDIRTSLHALADDLGEPGHDKVFGHGIINGASLCGTSG